MNVELKKKYGLFTAVAMVVGIVIGSGVFFKAEAIHNKTGGDMTLGILAWIIGGLIMMACAYVFSIMATKYEKVNGLVDYAEATAGSKYAYYVGWFMSTIYLPTLTSVLAWVSARYTIVLFNPSAPDITGGACMTVAALYLIGAYALNSLSPIIAGKFQVSTTVIKLIPLILMAIIGTLLGLSNGMLVQNFSTILEPVDKSTALFAAVVATAFAYEGWIIATSINAELKNAKRNLPLALVFGSIIIIVVYILYYVGLAGAISNKDLVENGAAGVSMAFTGVFGNVGGTLLMVFVVISCLGTLNGLMLGCVRGIYSIATRKFGPRPDIFNQVDERTNMPANSSIFGLLLCALWLFFFYGANLNDPLLFGKLCFDSSELPIVTIYALYIPIFVMFMFKADKSINTFNRVIMPIIAVIASLFMVVAAVYAHKWAVVSYLIVFAVIMIIGVPFSKAREIK